jgi:hypothetical protein
MALVRSKRFGGRLRLLACLLVVGACGGVVFAGAATAVPPGPNTFKLLGTVLDACTGGHLGGVTVTVSPVVTAPGIDPTAVESNPGGFYKSDLQEPSGSHWQAVYTLGGYQPFSLVLPPTDPGDVLHIDMNLLPVPPGPNAGCIPPGPNA